MSVPINDNSQFVKGMQSEEQIREALLQRGINRFKESAGYIAPKTHQSLPMRDMSHDTRPIIPSYLMQQFRILWRSGQLGLIHVWCEKLSESDMILPDEWLPVFINEYEHFTSIIMLFSQRIKWLFAEVKPSRSQSAQWEVLRFHMRERNRQNPLPAQDVALWWKQDEAWQGLLHFIQRRKEMPQIALHELQQNWSNIDVAMRYRFVHALRHNLSEEDAHFLTSCIYDNPRDTLEKGRLAFHAACLLTEIESSATGQQIIRSIMDLVYLRQIDNQWILDYRWSNVFKDIQIFADKKIAIPMMKLFGSTVTTQEFLQIIPLRYWWHHWSVTPEIIMEAGLNSDSSAVFLDAWKKRIQTEKHHEFAHIYLKSHSWERVSSYDYVPPKRRHSITSYHPYYHLFHLLSWKEFQEIIAIQLPYIEEKQPK